MSFPVILLLVVALGTLFLGFEAWRLTSNRALLLNTFVGSLGLVIAAYLTASPGNGLPGYVFSFIVSMLFCGRGIGTLWRSRKERNLRLPSTLMLAIASGSLYASVIAFCQQ
jgi:hypothetical protein